MQKRGEKRVKLGQRSLEHNFNEKYHKDIEKSPPQLFLHSTNPCRTHDHQSEEAQPVCST